MGVCMSKKKLKDMKYIEGGKRYKFMPSLNSDNACLGCVFDTKGVVPKECETNPSRDMNDGNCSDEIVIIRDTKQGLADYIAKRMEA